MERSKREKENKMTTVYLDKRAEEEQAKEEIEAAVSAIAGDAKSIDVELLSIKD